MKIEWLKPLLGRPGPFVTVYIDATRANEAGDRDVESRWRAVRRTLTADRAPERVLDAIEDLLLSGSSPHGEQGRVIVANAEGVLLDRHLRTAPSRNVGYVGRVPVLLEAVRSADEAVVCMRAVIDRQGADVSWTIEGAESTVTVDGGHDEITKTSSGPLLQRKTENRAEDSWDRNAEVVAAQLDRLVAKVRPDLLVLSGDVRAITLVRGELGKQAMAVAVDVPGASRSGGGNTAAFEAKVEAVTAKCRERRREEVLARYRQGQGRESGVVTSLEDVVAVLARGQVAELILAESFGTNGANGASTLWIGPDPLQIAQRRSQIVDLGVTEGIAQMPAPAALVRAAVGQDAGLTFAPDGSVDLIDGIGATLRWSDSGTPSEFAGTMSGDHLRVRAEHA